MLVFKLKFYIKCKIRIKILILFWSYSRNDQFHHVTRIFHMTEDPGPFVLAVCKDAVLYVCSWYGGHSFNPLSFQGTKLPFTKKCWQIAFDRSSGWEATSSCCSLEWLRGRYINVVAIYHCKHWWLKLWIQIWIWIFCMRQYTLISQNR